MKFVNGFALFVAAATVGGCAHPESTAHRSTRYYGLVDLDRSLEQRLRAELNSNPELSANSSNVLISAQNGTVTLSGVVPNEQTRREIDGIVRNTGGVEVVNDQLLTYYSPTGTYTRPPRIYDSPPE